MMVLILFSLSQEYCNNKYFCPYAKLMCTYPVEVGELLASVVVMGMNCVSRLLKPAVPLPCALTNGYVGVVGEVCGEVATLTIVALGLVEGR